MAGPVVAGPVVAGPVVAGPVVAGPVVAGPVVAGPVVAGPVVAGPVVAGPVVAGPVVAGPVVAGPVVAGPGAPQLHATSSDPSSSLNPPLMPQFVVHHQPVVQPRTAANESPSRRNQEAIPIHPSLRTTHSQNGRPRNLETPYSVTPVL